MIYQKTIFDNGSVKLMVNFSGMQDDIATAEDLRVHFYAYDRSDYRQIFEETLNIDQIRGLYEHLSRISIIKDDSATISGKFVETNEQLLQILDSIEGVDGNILKVILEKFNETEKIKELLALLSTVERRSLVSAHKHQEYRIAVENLDKLLAMEAAGDIVVNVKTKEELAEYVAAQPEKIFQNWVEKNLWVFGVEYIAKHDARKIALFSESDLFMESMDGFIDLIELKRPDYAIFQHDSSRNCYYPSSDLSKVIGQCLFYLQKMDEYKLNLEKEYEVKIIRPRIKIIAGRSNDFNKAQNDALRMLNSNLNHIEIITYDYLVRCGEKIISNYEPVVETTA